MKFEAEEVDLNAQELLPEKYAGHKGKSMCRRKMEAILDFSAGFIKVFIDLGFGGPMAVAKKPDSPFSILSHRRTLRVHDSTSSIVDCDLFPIRTFLLIFVEPWHSHKGLNLESP